MFNRRMVQLVISPAKSKRSQIWWWEPIVPTLRRRRQENHSNRRARVEASLSNIARPHLKNKNKNKQKISSMLWKDTYKGNCSQYIAK